MMPAFARAIGVDYSGAETPVSVLVVYSGRVSEGTMTRYRVIWHEPAENFLNIDYVMYPEVGDEFRYRMPVWPGGVTVVKKVTRPAGNEGRTCFAYIVAPSLAVIEDALKAQGFAVPRGGDAAE